LRLEVGAHTLADIYYCRLTDFGVLLSSGIHIQLGSDGDKERAATNESSAIARWKNGLRMDMVEAFNACVLDNAMAIGKLFWGWMSGRSV
jgi:hypothetical protein